MAKGKQPPQPGPLTTPAQCRAALDVAIADVRALVEHLNRNKDEHARAVQRDLNRLRDARTSWEGK